MIGFDYQPFAYCSNNALPGADDVGNGFISRMPHNAYFWDPRSANPFAIHFLARQIACVINSPNALHRVRLHDFTFVSGPGELSTPAVNDQQYYSTFLWGSDTGSPELFWNLITDPNHPDYVDPATVAGACSEFPGLPVTAQDILDLANQGNGRIPFLLSANFWYDYSASANGRVNQGLVSQTMIHTKAWSPHQYMNSARTHNANCQVAWDHNVANVHPMRATRHYYKNWMNYNPDDVALQGAGNLARLHHESTELASFSEKLLYSIRQQHLGLVPHEPWFTVVDSGLVTTYSFNVDMMLDLMFPSMNGVVEDPIRSETMPVLFYEDAVVGPLTATVCNTVLGFDMNTVSEDPAAARDYIVVNKEYSSSTLFTSAAATFSNRLFWNPDMESWGQWYTAWTSGGPRMVQDVSTLTESLSTSGDGWSYVLPAFNDATVTATFLPLTLPDEVHYPTRTHMGHYLHNGRSLSQGVIKTSGAYGSTSLDGDDASKPTVSSVLYLDTIGSGLSVFKTTYATSVHTLADYPDVLGDDTEITTLVNGFMYHLPVTELSDTGLTSWSGLGSWYAIKSDTPTVLTTLTTGGSVELRNSNMLLGFPAGAVVDEMVPWAYDITSAMFELGHCYGWVYSCDTSVLTGVQVRVVAD